MKRLLAAALFSAAVLCAASADRPRVTRAEVANVEKLINSQLAAMFPDEPWLLLGYTRGFYVEGTASFSAPRSILPPVPLYRPVQPAPNQGDHPRITTRKRFSACRSCAKRMYSVLKSLGTFFPSMPQDEQFILAVTILRYPWENGRRSSEPGGHACAARKTQRRARQEYRAEHAGEGRGVLTCASAKC